MVDGTALEMRHTCKGIVGSNPTLSAKAPDAVFYGRIEFGGRTSPPLTLRAFVAPNGPPDRLVCFANRSSPLSGIS